MADCIVRMARVVLSAVFFAGFGIGGLALGVLFALTRSEAGHQRSGGVRNRTAWPRRCVRASYRLFVRAAHATRLFRIEISQEDRRTLENTRGCVVAASHPSLIDVVVLMSLLPDSTAVAKAAAGRNFFYSRAVSAAFIVNDDPMRVLADASALIADGVNVVVFPEGTRTPTNARIHRLRRGAAQIALHAATPILCVSIDCDPPILAKGQSWWDVGARVIRFRIKVRGKIDAQSAPQDVPARAAAMSLTRSMENTLFHAVACEYDATLL